MDEARFMSLSLSLLVRSNYLHVHDNLWCLEPDNYCCRGLHGTCKQGYQGD